MRQLFRNGDVVKLSELDATGSTRIPAETSVADIDATQLTHEVLLLEFASFADGRGFSMAKILKRTLPATTRLVATGAIIPDQLELAWQCGFDSAIVSEERWLRYGPDNWLAQ